MKFGYKKIVSLIIIVTLLSGLNMILYTPYIPMYRYSGSDHNIEEDDSLLTNDHLKYMQIILEKNNEAFRVKNGVLYIKRTLQWNIDLLSNYTMKAMSMEKNS